MVEFSHVEDVSSNVASILRRETDRQSETLSLIPSENYVSEAVMEAQGSPFTNQYAEGYPGERYYGGCDQVDELERTTIKHAKELWGAEHVNVQPHSGTQANLSVYTAILEPGDTILSLDLTHGGHLSHGLSKALPGKLFDVVHYEVDEDTGYLDYDHIEQLAEECDPDVLISGYSAYPREVDWGAMQSIADSVDCYHVADIAHITGLVAAGEHPSPVGVADFVTGSTHKTIRAGRGGIIMCDEEYADDVDAAVMPGTQGGPLVHNIAGKAVGFAEALEPEFAEYAKQICVNATALAQTLQEHGFSLVSGGTDNHLVLVDLRDSHPDISGSEAAAALNSVGLVVNANTVPGETRSPKNPSGIRPGTPAITTRGFDAEATSRVGELIARTIDNRDDEAELEEIAAEVRDLCRDYPVYA